MSEASVTFGIPGELKLVGVLDYRSGARLREEGGALIRGSEAPSLMLDCSAVEHSSSVGLALLLAYMRDASAAGKAVSVRGLPEEMREIAQVYGVTELLDGH